MPGKSDTNKPVSKPVSKPVATLKPDTKKDSKSSNDKKKAAVMSGVVNLDDDWLYHSKK